MSDLVKRGSTYHIYWWDGGKKHGKTTKTSDYQVAKRIQHEHDCDILARRSGTQEYKTPIDTHIAQYLAYKKTNNKLRTWERDGKTIKHFKRLFPHLKQLQDITVQVLEDYKTKRFEAGVLAATVNRELGTIKAMLGRAEDLGIIKYNPGPRAHYMKEVKRSPRFLAKDEVATFLASPRRDLWWTAAYIGLYTGMRPEEILFLTWDDIKFENNRIVVTPKEDWTPKDYEVRWIPLEPHLHAFLARLKPKGPSRWVICQPDGSRPGYQVYCAMTGRVFRDLAIPKATLYTMRHTFASYLAMAGVPLNAIMRLLGHSKIDTTMVYAHLSPDYISDNTVSKLSFEK
jgi:integrase